MLSVVLSTLFWNQVLDTRVPDTYRGPRKEWSSSFAPQSKEDRNREFFKKLAHPQKEKAVEVVVIEEKNPVYLSSSR